MNGWKVLVVQDGDKWALFGVAADRIICWMDDEASARQLAREMNESIARMRD